MFINSSVEVAPEIKALFKDTASADPMVSHAAMQKLKAAISTVNPGILYGDTVTGIYEMQKFEPGQEIRYELDVVGPSQVKQHIAYSVPDTGYIPQRTIEGDYMTIRTYAIATSIDWSIEMARQNRVDVVARSMAVAEAGVIRKRNNDGWRTIIVAAGDRGISISDTSVANGLFSKRLVQLAQVVMRRNAGGNSTSLDRGRLTHIAMSPESLGDIRSWDLTQVDDITRREIFVAGDDVYSLTKIFGVTLVDLDELGVGQEYQKYYNNTGGYSTPNSKDEIAIGLDLAPRAYPTFVMPWVAQENGQFFEMHEDPTLLRMFRKGYWGRGRFGCSVLDNRKCIVLGI